MNDRLRSLKSGLRHALLISVIPLAIMAGAAQQSLTAEDKAAAPEPLPAGHSQHGEAFNEGPRQKAYLMEGIGKVNFPITTKNTLAQRFFNQGVGQLHGFWYFEAERSFRQVAALDAACAMAYWGMALANVKNEKRSTGFIAEAVKRKQGISEREGLYIDAWDEYLKAGESKNKERSQKYAHALEHICYKYPQDIEAKALLALQLWTNDDRGSPISSFLAVDSLLNQVLEIEPLHPCHHYRIHLWEKERAEKSLNSAALCGPSSPGIAHMWHMPGHTYSKLHRYSDAAWQQEASARVDHAHMIRDRVLPDQIHNFAHNNEWLTRNLSHIGRVHAAIQLAENMIELPRHPNYNTLEKKGSAYQGRLRLFEILSDFELWDDLIARAGTEYLEPTDIEAEQVRRVRYLGRAYFRKGDIAGGQQQLLALEERVAKLKQTQTDEANAAETKAKEEGKDPAQIETAKNNASSSHAEELGKLESVIQELRGEAAIAGADYKTGLQLLSSIKDKHKAVDKLRLAQVQLLAENADEAEKTVRAYLEKNPQEVRPLGQLVEVLWQRGKKPEAAEVFNELREISGSLDLDLPFCARLAPIARELNLPAVWRIAKPPAEDLGPRPALDTLGPFRWHPSPAPEWTLLDASGKESGLHQFRGKPVVLIFYLGYQCLHCAEQLAAFAPKAKDFSAAGISVVAVSTDNPDGLQLALKNYGDEPFPFTLVSDAGLEIFKAYRAFDDFENRPLHGTFLVDGEGAIRWQDIGHEPFQEPDFLLQEARRQLSQSAAKAVLYPPNTRELGLSPTQNGLRGQSLK